ncbi:hypothetical protein MesoLj113c_51460 [Mesorhizobium sp. 113-3-9]|nr:hypothetical protein MesoLj113c_51460 [Mesorhizobium sp. 113-3-9]
MGGDCLELRFASGKAAGAKSPWTSKSEIHGKLSRRSQFRPIGLLTNVITSHIQTATPAGHGIATERHDPDLPDIP